MEMGRSSITSTEGVDDAPVRTTLFAHTPLVHMELSRLLDRLRLLVVRTECSMH